MSISRWLCGFAALLLCFSMTGCDAGSGEPEVVGGGQSEIEKYLAENPDFDEGMDDGSTEEVE